MNFLLLDHLHLLYKSNVIGHIHIFSRCFQQHTTLHTTAGVLLKLSRGGPGQFLDWRPDAAGGGVGGPEGGTLLSGLKKDPNSPAVIGTLPCVGCRLSDGT